MNDKIVAIIQSRMGSTRLAGKVLMPILEIPVIQHIVNRLRSVPQISDVIIATSNKSIDDPIFNFCKSNSISFFRGDENDVLDRFYKAAKNSEAEIAIRITGDCPLVDPETIEKLISLFKENNYDFAGVAAGAGVANETTNFHYPDGLDAEIMKIKVLEIAWKEAKEALFREHVTPFIWKQPERFKLGTLFSDKDYGNYRWTLDHENDFKLISWIYKKLYPKNQFFGLLEIVDLLKSNEDKLNINNENIGKEGYEEFWRE